MTIRELAEEAEMVVQAREDLYEREDVLEAIESAIRAAGEPLAKALRRLIAHDKAADWREGLPSHCIELQDAEETLAAWEAK